MCFKDTQYLYIIWWLNIGILACHLTSPYIFYNTFLVITTLYFNSLSTHLSFISISNFIFCLVAKEMKTGKTAICIILQSCVEKSCFIYACFCIWNQQYITQEFMFLDGNNTACTVCSLHQNIPDIYLKCIPVKMATALYLHYRPFQIELPTKLYNLSRRLPIPNRHQHNMKLWPNVRNKENISSLFGTLSHKQSDNKIFRLIWTIPIVIWKGLYSGFYSDQNYHTLFPFLLSLL